jgi:hypothetical protein
VRLEDLAAGTTVAGVVPGLDVLVVAISWHGQSAVTLTSREASGRVAERLLYRDDEATLEVRGERVGLTNVLRSVMPATVALEADLVPRARWFEDPLARWKARASRPRAPTNVACRESGDYRSKY